MQVIKPLIVASFVAASAPLFAAEAPSTLTDAQRDEVRALVKEVLADANSRSSFVSGATAGIDSDGKVFLRSEDDAFGMNIGGLVQFRYDYHNKTAIGSGNKEGFDLRRVNLDIQGHLGGKDQARVDYRVLFGTQLPGAGSTQEVGIEEAYLQHEAVSGLTVRAGKFCLPYSREQLVGNGSQVSVDRSAVNSFFGLARAEGVQLQYEAGTNVLLRAALSDGGNSETTPGLTDTTNVAVTARADFLLVGSNDVGMAQFGDEFAIRDGSNVEGVRIGLAGYFEDKKATVIAGTPIENAHGGTVDATIKFANVALYGAGFFARTNPSGTAGLNSTQPWGALAQVDVAVAGNLDVFGMWQMINDDTISGAGNDVFQALTAGVNYHINSRVRLTVDGTYVLAGDGVLLNQNVGGTGINTTSNTGLIAGLDREIVARAQVQVKF